jgi:hypothetical protein
MTDTYTITLKPEDWLFVNAYQGVDFAETGKERYGVVIRDVSLLPEEIGNEAYVSSRGHVYLTGFKRPAVEHYEGWEKLESELRRMEATNRAPDHLFDGATLEVDFALYVRDPVPGSRWTTPLVMLPVTRIKIVEASS